jgi:hypothetical protein
MSAHKPPKAARSTESAVQKQRRYDGWMVYLCLVTSVVETLAGRPSTGVILAAVTYWGTRRSDAV